MKSIFILLMILTASLVTMAQDTIYISRDKVTALFFDHPVKLVSNPQQGVSIEEKGPALLTISAKAPLAHLETIAVNSERDHEVYRFPVVYSFGRAGRTVHIHDRDHGIYVPKVSTGSNARIANFLLSGDRADVAGRKREGKIKAWVNKISIANNRLYFRLDIRNKSNLPYDIDFIRFYIRDKKAVARVATHEQEVVPIFKTNGNGASVSPHNEQAYVFGFSRFPINEDQLLSVELYERRGNRNLVILLESDDFEDARPVNLSANH